MTEKEIDELARRVADAAVAVEITKNALGKLDAAFCAAPAAEENALFAAERIALKAKQAARQSLDDAVREYRARAEAAANCHKITTDNADEPTKETGQAQWRQVIGWLGEP